jgi:hypothetical protein
MFGLRGAREDPRMDSISGSTANWHIGQKLLLDAGRREVVVDEIRGDSVLCHWLDKAIARSAWIPARRLSAVRGSRDARTFLLY